MTFNQFKILPQEQQEFAMWHTGVPVANRNDRAYLYQLIQVDAFYIEVIYSLRFKTIQYITAFDNTDFLEPYLQEMEIDFFWKE